MKKIILSLAIILCLFTSRSVLSQSAQPSYILKYYNDAPGSRNIDLFSLKKKQEITSQPVISPDFQKAVFSKVYYYPSLKQTSSRLFVEPVSIEGTEMSEGHEVSSDLAQKILAIDSRTTKPSILLESGTKSVDYGTFRTLTVVDFSQDSSKVLIKEKIGENQWGIWLTNIWVYDFNTQKARRINEVREAIKYHWKKFYGLELYDYRWDIVPLGWDLNNPNRIVVNAYGYSREGEKHFLGCWGIDPLGRRSKLLSNDNESWPVGKYGLVISTSKQ